MSNTNMSKDQIRAEILKICEGQFRRLGEICEILQANIHTIRSRYIYPMVREKLLRQELPPGTRTLQRYKTVKQKHSSK